MRLPYLMSLGGSHHIFPESLLLLDVLLDARKLVFECRKELRVTVVEEFAILVFLLLFTYLGLLIGQTGALDSH